jgi:hypothetical protein
VTIWLIGEAKSKEYLGPLESEKEMNEPTGLVKGKGCFSRGY